MVPDLLPESFISEIKKVEPCPQCGADVTHYRGYIAWCERCNWNVVAQAQTKPLNRLDIFYEKVGKASTRRLLEQITATADLRPNFSLSLVIAGCLALLVHSITLLCAVAGAYLLIYHWSNLFAILGSVVLLGSAIVTRPRIMPTPKEIAPREKFPATYRLFDAITAALGTSPVEGIVFTPWLNASFSQTGWRRKKIVWVGVPLFSVLDAQEKVAIAAHELAHGINGDPLRGLFLGSAVNSLLHWSILICPQSIWVPPIGFLGALTSIVMIFVNLALVGLSTLLWYTAYALNQLVFYNSQRAEYLADYLAASISSATPMCSALEKLYTSGSFATVVQKVVLNKLNMGVSAAFREHIQQLPPHELERLRRAALLKETRLDRTHPPTAYRVEFLQKRGLKQAKITLTGDEETKINAELGTLKRAVDNELTDAFHLGAFNYATIL